MLVMIVMIHTYRVQIDKNDCEKVNILGPFHNLSSPNEKHSMPRGGTHLWLIKKKTMSTTNTATR